MGNYSGTDEVVLPKKSHSLQSSLVTVGLVRSYTILENKQNSNGILRPNHLLPYKLVLIEAQSFPFLQTDLMTMSLFFFIMSLPPLKTCLVSSLLDKSV